MKTGTFYYIPPTSMKIRKFIISHQRWCIYCNDWTGLFHICEKKKEIIKKRKKL